MSLFPSSGTAETKTEFKHRSKQWTTLLHHMQTKRHMPVLKTLSRKQSFSESKIAAELVSFWSSVNDAQGGFCGRSVAIWNQHPEGVEGGKKVLARTQVGDGPFSPF